jgi:hypothetical protein
LHKKLTIAPGFWDFDAFGYISVFLFMIQDDLNWDCLGWEKVIAPSEMLLKQTGAFMLKLFTAVIFAVS